jgi:hypothetical protein
LAFVKRYREQDSSIPSLTLIAFSLTFRPIPNHMLQLKLIIPAISFCLILNLGYAQDQKYDYATQTFLHEDSAKTVASIKQLDEEGNVVKELGLRNVYFGGDEKTWQIFKYSVRYPETATQKDIQGLVIIEARINKQGKLTAQKAISNIGYGLEEEGLRVFKLLPPDWVPVLGLSHLPPYKT